MTREQAESLTESLQTKLFTLPLSSTTDNFTVDEQNELQAVFGPEWASLLGISE